MDAAIGEAIGRLFAFRTRTVHSRLSAVAGQVVGVGTVVWLGRLGCDCSAAHASSSVVKIRSVGASSGSRREWIVGGSVNKRYNLERRENFCAIAIAIARRDLGWS